MQTSQHTWHTGSVGGWVRAARIHEGFTLRELARRSGCAASYLSAIEQGTQLPKRDDVWTRIETALRIPAGRLRRAAAWERCEKAGGPELREELRRLRGLEQAKLAASRRGPDSPGGSRGRKERVISGAASARTTDVPLLPEVGKEDLRDVGHPSSLAARAVDCVRVPGVHDPDAFAIRVTGSEMQPQWRAGDIAVVSPSKTVREGATCVLVLAQGGGFILRQVYTLTSKEPGRFVRERYRAMRYRLQPLNTSYAAQVVRVDDIRWRFEVVGMIRTLLDE